MALVTRVPFLTLAFDRRRPELPLAAWRVFSFVAMWLSQFALSAPGHAIAVMV